MPYKDQEKRNQYKREWVTKNRERIREYRKKYQIEYRAKQKEEHGAEAQRETWRLHSQKLYSDDEKRYQRARRKRAAHHGLTADEYDALIAKANGACELCHVTGKKLVLDHCHSTGAIRGVLCTACNTSIGKLGDTSKSLLRAVAYLQKSENQKSSEST